MRLPRAVPAVLVCALSMSACLAPRDLQGTLEKASNIAQTTKVLAADGSVLAELHAEIDREVVPLKRVPKHVRNAIVAMEDARFYQHRGVDYAALVRAFVRNAGEGEIVEGGSTITQQLVKNTLVEPERTLRRKIQEAVLARELERRLSKDEILERYLNTIYLGRSAYGIEAAAQTYFRKHAQQLTLGEGAMLAGMIRAPSRTDPVVDAERAIARRNLVLGRMSDLGFISSAVARRARGAGLGIRPEPTRTRYDAPYFVEHVKQLIFDGDEEFATLGSSRAERVNAVFKGGLRIETTLDPELQDLAERSIRETLPYRKDPYAAFVAIDPKNGGIVAMVGGRDFFATRDPVAKFNLATYARRQPGSAFKPFTLIAALEQGIPLTRSYRSGAHINVRLPGGGVWPVGNYEGNSFGSGMMSIERATALSVNVVYAQLVLDVGPERVVEVARRMGIETELYAYPSITLGAQEVTPLEMASAYATLASGGFRSPPVAVKKITDPQGTVLYKAPSKRPKVLDRAVVAQAVQALESVMSSGTGRPLQLGFPAAGKTGTSDEYRDAWFAGFTPRFVGVAWVGFPRAQVSMRPPKTRIRVFGSSWPGQIWRSFMLEAHRGMSPAAFPRASDLLVTISLDRLRGCRPNQFTPAFLVEQRTVVRGAEPPVCAEPRSAVIDAVPSVLGASSKQAERTLMLAGMEVSIAHRYCPSYRPRTICEQDPPPGARSSVGSRATIYLSDDNAMTRVPMVLAKSGSGARDELIAAGFEVRVVEGQNSEAYDGCRDASVSEPGLVWAQSPCAGATYGRGGIVTIYVN